MEKRIIYPNDFGGVAVIIPADCGLTLEEIAAKCVPPLIVYEGTGEFADDDNGDPYEVQQQVILERPYKIIDASEVPTTRELREAWEYPE